MEVGLAPASTSSVRNQLAIRGPGDVNSMQTENASTRSSRSGAYASAAILWLSFSLCFYPPWDSFLSRIAGLSLLGLAFAARGKGVRAHPEANDQPVQFWGALTRRSAGWMWAALALLAWTFSVRSSAGPLELGFGALAFSAAAYALSGSSAPAGTMASSFVLSAMVWVLLGWSDLGLGTLREALDGVAQSAGSALGLHTPLSLTQTALESLPCWILVGSLLTRRRSLRAGIGGSLATLALLHTARAAAMALWGPKLSPELLAVPLFAATGVTGFLILLLVEAREHRGLPRESSMAPRGSRHSSKVRVALIAAAVLAVLGIHGLQREGLNAVSRGERPGRILFYNESESPIQDFETPQWGHYGPGGFGMFGVLCDELQADGHNVTHTSGALTQESLEHCDLLALFNVSRQWTKDEFLAIWGFVERGGNLLVVTDHTDVQGTMRAANNVLAPFGLRVNFDSVLPGHPNGWFRPAIAASPALSRLDSALSLHWSVGASLSLEDGRAKPLISFPLSLLDRGDVTAVDRALLGNYSLDPGECFGEAVVAAESSLGDGRVVVLGDSGCFQNVVVARTYEDWGWQFFGSLVGGREIGRSSWTTDALWAGFWVLLVLALWRLRRTPMALWILSWCACYGLSAAHTVVQDRFEEPPSLAPRLVIDESHYSLLASYRSGEDGCSSLVRCFQREGWTADYMEEFDPRRLAKADAMALLAPQASYSPSEIATLVDYVDAGGCLILSVGAPQVEPVQELLKAFELSVTRNAVGAIPLHKDPERVKARMEFMDAWVVGSRAAGEGSAVWVLADYQGNPLMLLSERGRGRVLLVGDSRFFSDSNLESATDYIEPNLLFLRSLIKEMEREDPS